MTCHWSNLLQAPPGDIPSGDPLCRLLGLQARLSGEGCPRCQLHRWRICSYRHFFGNVRLSTLWILTRWRHHFKRFCISRKVQHPFFLKKKKKRIPSLGNSRVSCQCLFERDWIKLISFDYAWYPVHKIEVISCIIYYLKPERGLFPGI